MGRARSKVCSWLRVAQRETWLLGADLFPGHPQPASGQQSPSHFPASPEEVSILAPWRQRVSKGGSCDTLGDREAKCQQAGRQWEGLGLQSDSSHIFPVVTASLGHSCWFNFQSRRKQVAQGRVWHGSGETWVLPWLDQQLPCDLGWPLASSGAHVRL